MAPEMCLLKCTTPLLEAPGQRKIKKESGGYGPSVKNVMDMEKNELHKAAGEFYQDYSIEHLGEDVNNVDFAIAFHLHQTKQDEQPQADDKEGIIRELKWCVNDAHEEIQALKQANAELQRWKTEQLNVAGSFLEFMQNHPDVKLGQSCYQRAIEMIKERDELLSKHDKQ